MEDLLQSDAGNATNAADEALKTAGNCRHFAMCKIDFLGSGVCAPGLEKHYVSFYPEGRMDLYEALAENKIPITGKCVEIADSCTLCGKCDYQCYFVNEMRPSKVMKALKDHVGTHLQNGGKIAPAADDLTLTEMKKIVGDYWATNDPAIRITYHHDLCPHGVFKMPEYVVMPNSKEEISALIKLLNTAKVPYIVRGNGASSHGLVSGEGAIIDLNRMKTMDFDEKNWSVKVGPGIAAFDLQREAQKRGFRAHTAEPAALVCANIMTSGIISTFSNTYGIFADNYIDAEFVARDGAFFTLNDMNAPNLFSFRNTLSEIENMAICVSVSMKLHPVTDTVCKEQLSTTTDFVNVYEESKAQAEKVIAAYCEKHLLPLNIIRPPIVYGDSRTGRSLKFNALYYPIRSLQNIRDIYLNDIAHHGGQKSQAHGIYLDDEGFLFLPLRIYLPKKGSLNLIPVDYFVNATLKIIEKDLPGGIYHLTSKSPTTLETIAVYNERFMKVKGIEIIYSGAGNHVMRNPAEELFDRFIGPYRPYLSDARIFERTNSDRVTGDLQPPEFSAEIFNRCMEFAVRAQWGENLYGD